jgi:glutamate dehydrogenase
MAEGIACYKLFLSGLLDITDNVVNGTVVPPKQVVRHDADDPYLVVAADKGTATFSDIANGVSADYGFWLGDAFASGGSVGYDHKKMGITARGAWESVKRHFRALGSTPRPRDSPWQALATCRATCLATACCCREHIRWSPPLTTATSFIDPNPDVARSFAERQRLFKLPRSSWDDYDKSLISQGGGVYPRTAKSIPLSPRRVPLSASTAESCPAGAAAGHSAGAGGPALQRRHWHLRQGQLRDPCPGGRQGQ